MLIIAFPGKRNFRVHSRFLRGSPWSLPPALSLFVSPGRLKPDTPDTDWPNPSPTIVRSRPNTSGSRMRRMAKARGSARRRWRERLQSYRTRRSRGGSTRTMKHSAGTSSNLGDRPRGSAMPQDAAHQNHSRTGLSRCGEPSGRGPRTQEGLHRQQTQCGGQCPMPRLQSIAPSPATPREPGRRVRDMRTVPGQRIRSRARARPTASLCTSDRAGRDCLFDGPDAQLL